MGHRDTAEQIMVGLLIFSVICTVASAIALGIALWLWLDH